MSAKTAVGGFGDDGGKWLPLMFALLALGVIPRRYKPLLLAAAILWHLRG